jgi:hypothetical protein
MQRRDFITILGGAAAAWPLAARAQQPWHCAITVPMGKILNSTTSLNIDSKGIFNRKSVVLPGPWSIGVGADFEQARACPCFLPWAIPPGREVLLAS